MNDPLEDSLNTSWFASVRIFIFLLRFILLKTFRSSYHVHKDVSQFNTPSDVALEQVIIHQQNINLF